MSIILSNNELSIEDLLSLELVPGGEIRHTIFHQDGTIEGVSINNLLSIISSFCTDFSGNKFGGYLILPQEFWKRLSTDLAEQYARDTNLLRRTKYGGILGIFSNFTVYVSDELQHVYLKSDNGSVVYVFTVGGTHNPVSKKEVLDKYGYEKVGFDTRVVYMPQLLYPYAPPQVLLEWVAEDGYKPAKEILENPPEKALLQWWKQGILAEPTKEAMPKLLEAPK